jgi:hypothetical protein
MKWGARVGTLIAAMVAVVGATAWVMAPRPVKATVFTDVSGLWRMRETHADFEGTLRWTWLEIRQEGDHLEIRAWEDGDTWTCQGKGRVDGDLARFQWWGSDKSWRGLATLRLKDGELRGVFQRLDVHAGEQYCRGRRENAAAGAPAGGFDISKSRP